MAERTEIYLEDATISREESLNILLVPEQWTIVVRVVGELSFKSRSEESTGWDLGQPEVPRESSKFPGTRTE